MSGESKQSQIKLDLGEVYVRALRMRAGLDGVDPRDVVVAALERHAPDEIEAARKRLTGTSHAAESPEDEEKSSRRPQRKKC